MRLYDAFGWTPPRFLHMPLLRNRDQSKISKRKNPVSLTWYRDCGFLPEALLNFLSLMGYSLPPEKAPSKENPEIFSFDDLVRDLDLTRIKTSGPVFDLEKLDRFNGLYVRALPDGDLADRILDFLAYLKANRDRLLDAGKEALPKNAEMRKREELRRAWTRPALESAANPPPRESVIASLRLVRERLHGFLDWADRTDFLFAGEDLPYDASLLVARKKTPGETADALSLWADRHESLDPWDAGTLDREGRALIGTLGWKTGPFFMALRVAVTGRTVSPPLTDSMELLGRETTLSRVRSAVERLRALEGAP